MTVDLTMRSKVVIVTKILKKTKAKVFEDILVGDRIQVAVESKGVGGSRGRSYAVDVRIDNLTQGVHTYKTFNTLGPLDCFEYTYEEEDEE